jgi:hypothetical protein
VGIYPPDRPLDQGLTEIRHDRDSRRPAVRRGPTPVRRPLGQPATYLPCVNGRRDQTVAGEHVNRWVTIPGAWRRN